MNKLMDKLFNNIKFDKKYVLFSMIIVILGVICGALFIVILNEADKILVVEYVETFINSFNTDNNLINTFYNNIIINILIIVILCIIGITYFLFPINILILFYKSFVIGFSISSFILTYSLKGFLLSIIYIFPHLIINILIFCLLTAFTLKLSINMIKHIIKGKNINLKLFLKKYFCIFILSMIILSLTTLYESFVLPYIFKSLINIIL